MGDLKFLVLAHKTVRPELKDRILFLQEPIEEYAAEVAVKQ